MNTANIKLIAFILALGLLYPHKSNAQWYNTIDQQQQNAVIQSQQEHLIRQQEAARQRLLMEQRPKFEYHDEQRHLQRRQLNNDYQRQQYNNQLHRGF